MWHLNILLSKNHVYILINIKAISSLEFRLMYTVRIILLHIIRHTILISVIPDSKPVRGGGAHLTHPLPLCEEILLSPAEPQQQEEVDMDEPEEADVNTGSTQDQRGKTGNTDMEAEKRVEDTINVIPETDYKTTQSSSTGKVDDTDDNATDNAEAQEIRFGFLQTVPPLALGDAGLATTLFSVSCIYTVNDLLSAPALVTAPHCFSRQYTWQLLQYCVENYSTTVQ